MSKDSKLDALLEKIGVYEKIAAHRPHKVTKLLTDIFDVIESKGHSYRTSWDILVELLGHSLGLTVTRHKELFQSLNGSIREYCKTAIEEPWDYLGELFIDRRMENLRLGQNLTPREVVDLIVMMTLGEAKFDRVYTVLDPAVGTGRFLLEASRLYANAPLELYGIEIDVSLYRACLVNMRMFSNHPFHIVCADTLMLDIASGSPGSSMWLYANKWNPPDMTPWYWKPPPINARSFSLKYFTEQKAK